MKLKHLIKKLADKSGHLDEEVEFIIVTKKGAIIAMNVAGHATDIVKALKLFPRASA